MKFDTRSPAAIAADIVATYERARGLHPRASTARARGTGSSAAIAANILADYELARGVRPDPSPRDSGKS